MWNQAFSWRYSHKEQRSVLPTELLLRHWQFCLPLLMHHPSSCQHSGRANNVSQVLWKYIWPCKLPTGSWQILPQGSVDHTFYNYCVDSIIVNLYKAHNRYQTWLYALIILILKCTDIWRAYYIPEHGFFFTC